MDYTDDKSAIISYMMHDGPVFAGAPQFWGAVSGQKRMTSNLVRFGQESESEIISCKYLSSSRTKVFHGSTGSEAAFCPEYLITSPSLPLKYGFVVNKNSIPTSQAV